MARYNIELSAGINAGTVKAAADGLEKIGLSAEEAQAQLKEMGATGDAASDKLRQGMLSAAAAVDHLMDEAESGSPRAVKAISRVTDQVEELRRQVEAAQKAGAPIPTGALQLLGRYDQAVDQATRRVAHMQNVSDDTRDKLKSLRAQTDLNRGSVNDLGDVLELQGSKWADVTGKVFAFVGALTAGWEAGKKLEQGLDWLTNGKFTKGLQDSIAKTMEFLHLWEETPILELDPQYQRNLANIRSKRPGYQDRADLSQQQTKDLEARLKKEDEARKKAEADAKKEAETYKEQLTAIHQKLDAQQRLNKAAAEGLAAYERQVVVEQRQAALLAAIKGLTGEHAKKIREASDEQGRLEDATKRVVDAEKAAAEQAKEIGAAIEQAREAISKLADEEFAAFVQRERDRQAALFQANIGEPMLNRAHQISDYREQLRPIGDSWAKEVKRIRELTQVEGGKWGLSVQESTQLITRLYMQAAEETVSQVQGILTALQGIIGQRGGLQTAQHILGTAQNVYGFYRQVDGLTSQMAARGWMSSGTASAISGVAGTFAVFAAVYEGVSAYIEKQKSHRFGNAMSLVATQGQFGFDALSFEALRFVHSLQDTIEGIAGEIHASVEEMPKVSIRVRNDGKEFEAVVGDMFVGVFSSLEDATSAALAQVVRQIQFRGASPLAEQVLQNSHFQTIEELNNSLQMAQELTDSALSDTERAMRDIQERFQKYIAWMRENHITDPSAGADLAAMTTADITSLRNQITGHQMSPQEQLAMQRQQGELFNARLVMMRSELQLERIREQSERDALERRGLVERARGSIERTDIEIDRSALIAGAAFNAAKADQVEERANLYQVELDAMDANIHAIDDVLAAIANIKPIDPNEIKLPRSGGRGGAGQKDPLQSAIDDVHNMRLGEWGRQVHDVTAKWSDLTHGMGDHDAALRRAAKTRDEAIKAAHGNAEAIKKANAEYAKTVSHINRNADALRQANAARDEELRLLGEKARKENITPYTGRPGDRTPEAQQLADLHATYSDLRTNRQQLHLSLAEVNAAEMERARLLGLEVQASLGIESAGASQELEATAQKLAFLRDHAQELGLTAQQVAGIAAQVDQNYYLTMAERIARATGNEKLLGEVQEARYEIDKANMALSLEKARLEKVITEETYARLAKILGEMPDKMPASSTPTTTGAGGYGDILAQRQEEAAKAMQDAATRFADAVKRLDDIDNQILFGDQGLLSPDQQIAQMMAQVRSLAQGARGGDLASVEALSAAERQALDVIRRTFGSTEAGANDLAEILGLNRSLRGLTGINVGNVGYDARLGFPLPYTPVTPAGSAPPPGQDATTAIMQAGMGLGREVAQLRSEVAGLKLAVQQIAAQMAEDYSLRRRESSALESVLRLVR